MYSFTRFNNAYAATDVWANAVAEGWGCFTNNPNAGLPGDLYLTLYKYDLDIVASTAVGVQLIAPALCWVTSAGVRVDVIEYDIDNTAPAVAGTFQKLSYSHDYGPDGKTVYVPFATAGAASYLGVLDLIGTTLTNVITRCKIQFEVEVDYRYLGNIPEQTP